MGTEARKRDGTASNRNILTHPKTQAGAVLALIPVCVILAGLIFTAGQDDERQIQIAKDVAEIKETLRDTNPAVLAAQIKALSDRLGNQQDQLSTMWRRLAAARISVSPSSFTTRSPPGNFSPVIDGRVFD